MLKAYIESYIYIYIYIGVLILAETLDTTGLQGYLTKKLTP